MGSKGGDISVDMEADIDSTNSMEIIGLDDINMRMELAVPDPIRTEGRNEFAVTEPIRMENDLNSVMEIRPIQMANDIDLDIRPVVMDLCFKLEFGAFPQTSIRRPYSHHFGITLFGTEVLGFNLVGETRTIIEDIPKKPQLVLGGRGGHGHHEGHGGYAGGYSGEHGEGKSEMKSGSEGSLSGSGGLRIRFD